VHRRANDPPAKIIPFPVPKPRLPEDDCGYRPNLIIPTQIWLEGTKPEPRLRPPTEVIPLPTASAPKQPERSRTSRTSDRPTSPPAPGTPRTSP